ncbi:MAG: UDP-N-acetylmuramoyl-L-alanyl-D-glutamate--2,6-diaminopimelate ligase, partial [Candidatus Eisenbacteria bacterium]|nr:UDP-N-acetylmuramoyl-L-alanyl-D-glutamate--2,6-diaminopimelate ligase [Candidatus Eisenbacteria bacterium]
SGDPATGGRRVALGRLLEAVDVRDPGPEGAVGITSVEYDSRRVGNGSLFVAVRGFVTDGHRFVADAAEQGAAAALVESLTGASPIPEFVVPDTRRALGLAAHEFFGHPSDSMTVHGITGTNGKTTTSYLVHSIMQQAGLASGVVGTLGHTTGGGAAPGSLTSPEASDLAALMASMADAGVEVLTMEVSSHALALERTAGTRFDTATFTNLSRDHLDFHRTLDEYWESKRKLFEQLSGGGGKPDAAAVVNTDDPRGRELAAWLRRETDVRLVTFGITQGEVRATDIASTVDGTTATIVTPRGTFAAEIRLLSTFNVMNALAATSVALAAGVELGAVAEGLRAVTEVAGRLERVDAGQPFTALVDYAHTPDALEKALAALRDLDPGRLIVVFGCGGDRDRGKRPQMGEIAARQADVVIVTSDNPRTEDPSTIIADILNGVRANESGADVEVVPDRRAAIVRAVGIARKGDVVLVAGKGHEDYQIIGTEKRHFDDREEIRAAVETTLPGGE